MILTEQQLLAKIQTGETSFVQFKERINDADSLEAEIVAFANALGGSIVVGVADNGNVTGLTKAEKEKYVQLNSNVSTQRINPPINTLINAFLIDEKLVMVIEVPEGDSKPYFTKNGTAWTKTGADKRKASRNELERLFHNSKSYFMDEQPVPNCDISEINMAYFSRYYHALENQTVQDSGFELSVLLNRMGIASGNCLNFAGTVYFADNPDKYFPITHIKAVAFQGTDIADVIFRDKQDIKGRIEEQYRGAMDFLKRNLRRVQGNRGFNTQGQLEISEIALEEVITNAFFHRDYTKSSPIRILLFDDRLEIISPGALPNHLTIENIQYGDTVIRNHRIVSFGVKILPHSGLGSGVKRILKEHPKTEFINLKEGQQFKVIMWR